MASDTCLAVKLRYKVLLCAFGFAVALVWIERRFVALHVIDLIGAQQWWVQR